MEENFILHQAKKYVAIAHGFKSWDDISNTLNTGFVNDGEIMEASLLNEVAIRYGETLLNFHNTNKRILAEDLLRDTISDHVNKNISVHNSLFSDRVLKMRQAGFSSEDIVFNLIDIGSDLFAKFQKLLAEWPIKHANIPEL